MWVKFVEPRQNGICHLRLAYTTVCVSVCCRSVPRAVGGHGVLGVPAVPRSLAAVRLELVLGLGVRAADGSVAVISRR
jgi:hypothetical protein